MWIGIGILGVFLWIMISLWPAFIAKNKGRSFLLWWLFSIFFWWITLFVALAMKDESGGTAAPAAE